MKIEIPEGMLDAARNATKSWEYCLEALDAALLWLAENPIVPTDGQMQRLYEDMSKINDGRLTHRAVVEWQRRMFLEPNPEVPEAIKDLLLDENSCIPLATNMPMPMQSFTYTIGDAERKHNAQVIEAYRRGKARR